VNLLVIALPVAIPVVVPVSVPVIVIGTTTVGPIAVSVAWTYRINLNEVSVLVDVNMVANTAFAGVKAVGEARPFKAHIIVAAPPQGLFGLVY
jgi:hypothetical protein